MSSLRISSLAIEKELHVSKFLKTQVLLDQGEMQSLFHHLQDFYLFIGSSPESLEGLEVSKESFLKVYSEYQEALAEGNLPDIQAYRKIFSCFMTASKDCVFAIPVGKDRFLAKVSKPVIQMQVHQFFISSVDGSFHPMVLSQDSITWGLQFSYPQLYQDPKSHEIKRVLNDDSYPNSKLFHLLMKWIREHTLPTPFEFMGKKNYVPIRLGKECLSWIQHHPQLKERGIKIAQST